MRTIKRSYRAKDGMSLRYFLQQKIEDGELSAETVEGTEAEHIKAQRPYLLTDVKGSKYHFFSESHGGGFDDEGSQTQYSTAVLEQLMKGFGTHRITGRTYFGDISIEPRYVKARVSVRFSTDYDGGAMDASSPGMRSTTLQAGNETIKPLMTEVYKFSTS